MYKTEYINYIAGYIIIYIYIGLQTCNVYNDAYYIDYSDSYATKKPYSGSTRIQH